MVVLPFVIPGQLFAGGYEGYACLLTEILKFFKTKLVTLLSATETLELFLLLWADI